MTAVSVYTVKTEAFEGPLELLLRLIEEKKLHISRISLATVADQFLAHLQSLPQFDKNLAVNFIYIASTLMLIKSVSLLPNLKLSPEEEQSITELEERLRRYQRMKELSKYIRQRFGKRIIFFRESALMTIVFAPTAEITLTNLVNFLKQLVASLPQPENLPSVTVKKVRNLEEVINTLVKRIQAAIRLSFTEVVVGQAGKINVILNFLGMLELVKRGIINAEQAKPFQDITLHKLSKGL